MQAAAAPAGQLPAPAVVLAAMLLPRLGWPLPGREPVCVASLVVRAATALLTIEAAAARAAQYLAPFAALAAGAPPPPLPPLPPPLPSPLPPLAELSAVLRRLWRLPWENGRKETFWRLAYDALPTAARLHVNEPCPCGAAVPRPGRQHHFWDCPVARAVVGQLEAARAVAAAPAPPPAPPTLADVWLARPPNGVHAGVWGVVCLAAVEAMDHGRRRLTGLRLRWRQRQQHWQPPQQQQPARPRLMQLTLDGLLQPAGNAGSGGSLVPPPPAPAAALERAALDPGDPADFLPLASRSACKLFSTLLCHFAALGCAPASWPAACRALCFFSGYKQV